MRELLFIIIAISMIGCVRDDMPPMSEADTSPMTRSSVPDVIMTSDSILQFRDASAFEELYDELYCMSTEEEKIEYIGKLVPGFVSIKALYNEALFEADSIPESLEAYEAFKCKHPDFYYANEDEDAGFYIQMEDQDLAYLVSPTYEIMIGDERHSVKDSDVYPKLKAQGLTYDRYTRNEGSFDMFYNELWDIPKPNYQSFIFKGKKIDPLPSYGANYTSKCEFNEDLDRSVTVSVRRRAKYIKRKGSSRYWQGQVHIDVCFRKRLFGDKWYNYSSRTSFSVKMREYGDLEIRPYGPYKHKGRSAHDASINIPCHVSNDGKYSYTFEPLRVKISLDYQGIPRTLEYDCGLAGARFTDPESGPNPIPVGTTWQ